ncbi:hypothetical protein CN640_13365 [Bacillus pseudomycoides]|nr:hypothetical protein CN640_13365 [Bacillus pseudomycoides]
MLLIELYFKPIAVLGMRGQRTQQVKVRPKSTSVEMGGHEILPLDLKSDSNVRLKENKAGRGCEFKIASCFSPSIELLVPYVY